MRRSTTADEERGGLLADTPARGLHLRIARIAAAGEPVLIEGDRPAELRWMARWIHANGLGWRGRLLEVEGSLDDLGWRELRRALRVRSPLPNARLQERSGPGDRARDPVTTVCFHQLDRWPERARRMLIGLLDTVEDSPNVPRLLATTGRGVRSVDEQDLALRLDVLHVDL